MRENGRMQPVVFRIGRHLYVVAGVFATFFIALGIAVALKRGDWTLLALASFGTVVFFALLSYPKLAVEPSGFTYRNLSMNRSIAFADIEQAYFKTLRHHSSLVEV